VRDVLVDAIEVYADRIEHILAELRVPADHPARRLQPLVPEAGDVVSIGADVFGREQFLVADVALQWAALQQAAARDGVELQVVSAFRSVEAQRRIFERKITAGQTIADILQVNALPGCSEHHSGRALDLTTPGVEPLTEAFERTEAFAWLTRSAPDCGLRLSYPRGNPFGVIYEPWHWYFLVRSEWS
jgi:D-alanyl-D-alanine carboxypeptidase